MTTTGDVTQGDGPGPVAAAAGLVLMTLASSQFLMTLDSSVMNVSMATVASDVGTDITGIQTAITLYTLVMATLMITGGKIGSIIGRRKAFAIGCVIYGAGSFTTGMAPSLPVLIFGWSFLEGAGAALIMPAIVALVAGNFAPEGRPRAYGLVAAAGAIAVAAGPLIGGAATTYASWRLVFFGEVVVVIAILVLCRRIADAPVDHRPKLDPLGTVLSIAGLGAGALAYGYGYAYFVPALKSLGRLNALTLPEQFGVESWLVIILLWELALVGFYAIERGGRHAVELRVVLLDDELGGPGDPGSSGEHPTPPRVVHVDEAGRLRPGTQQAHVAAQHVPHLRQLVEAPPAHRRADRGDAVVVGCRDGRPAR